MEGLTAERSAQSTPIREEPRSPLGSGAGTRPSQHRYETPAGFRAFGRQLLSAISGDSLLPTLEGLEQLAATDAQRICDPTDLAGDGETVVINHWPSCHHEAVTQK
jgi:hypothetical protein